MTRRLRCCWPFEPWDCSCCGRRVEGAAPSATLRGLACDSCLDRGWQGEPFIPLTVRSVGPVRKQEQRPVVAVGMREGLCVLEGGEAFDLPGLVDRVRERRPGELGRAGRSRDRLPERLPASIIVTDQSVNLLAYLDNSACSQSPFWQWQVSIRAATAWRPEATRKNPRPFLMPKPVRFGYASRRNGERRAKGESLWYLLLDPNQFCEVPDGWGKLAATDLLRFARELIDWCNAARLPLLQGVSSYGSRLLRDDRFGQGWRRKIPASTNRRIRRRLPGNHYQLLTRPGMTHPEAHKFDQHAAHHHAAAVSRFPHPDELDAHGYYRREAPRNGQPFERRGAIRVGTRTWEELTRHAGLFHIAVKVPERVAIDNLTIPALRKTGVTWQTVTSIELDHLRGLADDGVKLLDIHTCWTSPDDDDRLREYAWWAGEQLQAASAGRQWLKPLLLAAYGMLAARPARFRNGWRWVSRPDGAVGWATPHGQLIGLERSSKRDREPQTANVLWRAIIESSVRLESLTFARQLRAGGLRPLAVYADAVFATGGYDPALGVPVPWRYDGLVHRLTFESAARYRSSEETRLPGSPRRERLADPFTGRANVR